ncbi:MAG: hypothetical protein M9962_02035 [Oligoflexia bacterium]|nr:hypothetical protein [Oligoflexia bacterium]
MLKFLYFLFIPLFFLTSQTAFSSTGNKVSSCHAKKIIPTLYSEKLNADISFDVFENDEGEISGKIRGYYIEPDGSRTTMSEVAKRSDVDPMNLKGDRILNLDYSYALTLNHLVTSLGNANIQTNGMKLIAFSFFTDIKTKNCSVIEGQEFCQEINAPFGHYLELHNKNGRRLASAVSISGGWYLFSCE